MVGPRAKWKILFGLARRLVADPDVAGGPHHRGDGGVHVAGAGRRAASRRPHRHLLVRVAALRAGDREAAVCGPGSMPCARGIAEYVARSAAMRPSAVAPARRCRRSSRRSSCAALARRPETATRTCGSWYRARGAAQGRRTAGGGVAPGGAWRAGLALPARAPRRRATVRSAGPASRRRRQLLETSASAMPAWVARRDALVRQAVERCGGSVVEATSDGFLFVVRSTRGRRCGGARGAARARGPKAWSARRAARRQGGCTPGARGAPASATSASTVPAPRGSPPPPPPGARGLGATAGAARHAELAGLGCPRPRPRRLSDLRYPEHLFAVRACRGRRRARRSRVRRAAPQPAARSRRRFVGREAQIAEVRRLLLGARHPRRHAHGPVAPAKTRLSLEVAPPRCSPSSRAARCRSAAPGERFRRW